MPNIERVRAEILSPTTPTHTLDGRTARQLRTLERQTLLRMANVQAEAVTTVEKLREADRVAETALMGHVLLNRTRTVLAGADPLLFDELGVYTDIAKLARIEVLADFTDRMRHQ